MKKLFVLVLCALLVCPCVVSCDKDKEPDEEIKYENDDTTKPPKAQTDDPSNGYGDIITPKY